MDGVDKASGGVDINDITVCLRNSEGGPKLFRFNSSVLKAKSKFFADKLSIPNRSAYIEIYCLNSDYQHHIDLLNLLPFPASLLLDSWGSVKSALGILQVAIALQCEEVTNSCIQYLEAVPWDDKEEEEILNIIPKLGPVAMPILARIQPVDLTAAKTVFISAVQFATSVSQSCHPFGDEVKTSAQEQIEYMLAEDEDTPLIAVDDEVKSEVKKGLSRICSSFQNELTSLLLEATESRVLQIIADFQWLCNVLPKMELMGDLVSDWAEMSDYILNVITDSKLDSAMWATKLKLIEITGKVLEAVGYGTVIVPSSCRSQLVKKWLPYIRKIKPVLDSICDKETGFYPHRIDEDLCQGIEGAIVSLVLALPSNDQADILADWMENNQQFGFPDLSEAFEIWCYRTKSAKRRLIEGQSPLEGLEGGSAPSVSDLSA